MENEILTQEMKDEICLFMELAWTGTKTVESFLDWNFFHRVYYEFRTLRTGRHSIDEQIFLYSEEIENAISTQPIQQAFITAGNAITWYNSLFKKPKAKKDGANKNNIINGSAEF